MLVHLNVWNARVRDFPSRPVYGVGEQSGIKLRRVVPRISWLLVKGFFWRLREKYVIRDFHPLVFFYALGILMTFVGLRARRVEVDPAPAGQRDHDADDRPGRAAPDLGQPVHALRDVVRHGVEQGPALDAARSSRSGRRLRAATGQEEPCFAARFVFSCSCHWSLSPPSRRRVDAPADAGLHGPPTATGTGGAAATVDTLATQAAVDMLRRGGNAVDAAVTAAAVLGVTEPFSCGVGGGGFMVLYRASDGKVTTIDGRESAPAAMRPDSFWENGRPLPFNDARYSGLSVGVPGTVETWDEALERYGTISLAEVLVPAIRAARDGFVVDQTFVNQTQENLDYFNDIPATAALYLDPDGTPHDVGTVFRNPDLARTYERIAHLGAKGFYRGAVADALVETVQQPVVAPTANHTWRSGLLTMHDLHTYTAPERAPARVSYRGVDVYGMGPPSSGGSTVGEALNILEGYPLSTMTREAALHYFLEASRYSFADRGAYLADPAYFDVPLTGLLSDEFAATRRSLITGAAATSPVAPGDPYPFNGTAGAVVQASAARPGRGRPPTSRPPIAGGTPSPTPSRSSPRAAPASSSRAGASSRTTSSRTSTSTR